MNNYQIPLDTKIVVVFGKDINNKTDLLEGVMRKVDNEWLIIETDYGDILYINRDKIRYIRESERNS